MGWRPTSRWWWGNPMVEAGQTFRSYAFDGRVGRLTDRAALVRDAIADVDAWLSGLPARVAEGKAGAALFEMLPQAQEAAAQVAGLSYGPYTAEWFDDAHRVVADAVRACGALPAAELAVQSELKAAYPDRASPRPGHFSTLLAALGSHFVQDLFWMRRTRALIDNPGDAAKHRTQRLRARRKAGYQMVTVAIHKDEIAELRRLGLIQSITVTPSAEQVTDAMQVFVGASFAATSADFFSDDLKSDEALSDDGRGLLRAWPVVPFMRRLARLAG